MLLIPVSLVVALATGSRGPILVLVVVAVPAVVRAVLRLRSRDLPRIVSIAGAGIAIVLAVSLASNTLPILSTARFSLFGEFVAGALTGDAPDPGSTDTSSTARISFFGAAATMFEERPLIGFGTAGFEAVSGRFLGETEAYPHNAVLQFAAEFGLVGLGLFLALVVFGLTRPLAQRSGAVRVLFLYFLLAAMLSGDIFSDRTTWGLLTLMLLMGVSSREPPTSEPRDEVGNGQSSLHWRRALVRSAGLAGFAR
jgi:O-antigen ligase